MKRIIYYQNKVISHEEHNGESITLGTDAFLFIGTEGACRRKVKELGLDYDEYDLASPVIPPCTPRQIRLWLLSLGITESMVEAQINQIEDLNDRAATMTEFKYASEFQRNHNFVTEIGLSLGLTEDEIDSGFIIAGGL